MKALRMILLFVVCTAMAACGGENLDVYKDKVLEEMARVNDTTKELLVKDLDINIDSMSLLYFYVEDSIVLAEKKFKEFLIEKEKQIESCKKSIEKNEKELNDARNSLFSYMFVDSYSSILDKLRKKIENTEKEIQEETELYNQKLEKLKSRDKKEVIFNVFVYRASMKNPLTGMHNAGKSMSLFTPDGETYLKEADKKIREQLMKRETK